MMSDDMPSGPIGQTQYLAGRMFAGCDALQSAGDWGTADEAFTEGVDFGEREIFLTDDQGESYAQLDQMPVAVISTNMHNEQVDGNDCQAGHGIIAAHVYLASRTDSGQWHGQNFYSSLLTQLWGQSGGLNSPGPHFTDLTLPITKIEILGPTRTPLLERGRDGENDYWDAVFMMYWSDE